MSIVSPVVTITASSSGHTMMNWPYAPSPRKPCRFIQYWNPYPCCQSIGSGAPGPRCAVSLSICFDVAVATHSGSRICSPCQRPSSRTSCPVLASDSVKTWMPLKPISTSPSIIHCASWMPSGSSRRGRR